MDPLYLALRFERAWAWLAFARECIDARRFTIKPVLNFVKYTRCFLSHQNRVS